jgi:hypothetical protein
MDAVTGEPPDGREQVLPRSWCRFSQTFKGQA